MKKPKITAARIRRWVQVGFLLFFVLLFLRARYPYTGNLESDLFLRFSPLIPLFNFIADLKILLLFWPALIILGLTIFFGRFFCGWICPLGTSIDITSHALKSPDNKVSKRWQSWRPLKFVLLLTLIVLAIFSINAWGYFDPISIFTRAMTVTIYPLATLVTEAVLIGISRVSFLEAPAMAVYDGFKSLIMPESQAFTQEVLWITLFFGVILGLEKLSRRFWCRNLCPAGALLGFLSQFRFYERLVSKTCPSCGKCNTECKMNAIPEDNVMETSKVECIECFNCGETCPPKIKAITYRWRWKPYHTSVDYSRRQFIQTSFSSIAALGLLSVGYRNKEAYQRMIRPPGALPEDEFLDKCIRCEECVRICQSNGACLQPDGIRSNLLELWAPVAVMRRGYCEYNCNLCGEVCPTEAIQPLTLEEKQITPMGLAYFNKNLCIPYAKNEDCIVCEEHCPLHPKAIQIDEKGVTLPDGSVKRIKYPYIVVERCIGCGICENKCPLPGDAAVVVMAERDRNIVTGGGQGAGGGQGGGGGQGRQLQQGRTNQLLQ